MVTRSLQRPGSLLEPLLRPSSLSTDSASISSVCYYFFFFLFSVSDRGQSSNEALLSYTHTHTAAPLYLFNCCPIPIPILLQLKTYSNRLRPRIRRVQQGWIPGLGFRPARIRSDRQKVQDPRIDRWIR